MAVAYADYLDIEAQINHILNRNPAGEFSAEGDTSASSDDRYSDGVVTEARRKAAHRIFEAIGSNLSHPFWGELKTDVPVNHGDPIPPHYGQIGVPLILPSGNSTGLLKSIPHVSKEGGGNTVSFTPTDELFFAESDEGLRLVIIASGEIVIDAVIENFIDAGSVDLGADSYTVGTHSTTVVTGTARLYETGSDAEDDVEFLTGLAASADEIDAYRRDPSGVMSDYFGTGALAHDQQTAQGLDSPLSKRYSTGNDVIKFTGAECRIPMIARPEAGELLDLPERTINGVEKTTASTLITDPADGFEADDLNKRVTVSVAGVIVIDQIVLGVAAVPSSIDVHGVNDVVVPTGTGTAIIYGPGRTVADTFVDEHMPLDLASLNVKLAMPLLIKEGDSLYRLAVFLGAQGENELLQVKAGAVQLAPIKLQDPIQLAQRLGG